MEYEGNTNESSEKSLEIRNYTDDQPTVEKATKVYESNFSKRWKKPTKDDLIKSLDESVKQRQAMDCRIGTLEGTVEQLISYINQRIP